MPGSQDQAFAAYLQQKGIRSSSLAEGMQQLEAILGKCIAAAYGGSPDVAKGLLWANNATTPNASPQDVEIGLNTLRQTILSQTNVKQAQGLVEMFDPKEYLEQPGINLFVSQDAANQPQNPLDSQQIGRTVIPAFSADDKEHKKKTKLKKKKKQIFKLKSTIDERICGFVKVSITK